MIFIFLKCNTHCGLLFLQKMYAQTYYKKYAVSYIYGATYFAATLDMHDVYDFLFKDENLFYYNEHGNYFFVISISFDVGIKLFSHFFIQEMNYATVFAKITTDWQAIKKSNTASRGKLVILSNLVQK